MVTKEELVAWAVQHGWRQDRWGHLKKVSLKGEEHRLKLSKMAVRHEVFLGGRWLRLSSGYFKNLIFTPEGKLSGLR